MPFTQTPLTNEMPLTNETPLTNEMPFTQTPLTNEMRTALFQYATWVRRKHHALVANTPAPEPDASAEALSRLLRSEGSQEALRELSRDKDALAQMCGLLYADGPVDVAPVVACIAQRAPHLLGPQRPYGCSVFHHACKAGAVGVLRALATGAPRHTRRALRERNSLGMQPLAFALLETDDAAALAVFQLLLPLMSELALSLPDAMGNNLLASVRRSGRARLLEPVFRAPYDFGIEMVQMGCGSSA